MQRFILFVILLTLSVTLGLLPGCSDTTAPDEAGSGQIVVNLIDAPGDYEAVNLQVVAVECHRADLDSNDGWLTLATDTTRVDLLELTNGTYEVLADAPLAAGDYTQIRLILSDSNTVTVDGETFDLSVPSGSESGLKLNHPFSIVDGGRYEVTLDFDADRSIHLTGSDQYILHPVIRLIVNDLSGSVRGVIMPIAARASVQTIAGGDTVLAYADTLTGQFRNMMLPPGTYDLEIKATADGYRDSTVSGIEVTAGDETNIGTIILQDI